MRRALLICGAVGLALSAGSVAAQGEGSFTTIITGDVEATVEAPGDLRCIGMGDSGPGYLEIRNGHRTEKISFQLPLGAEAGEHEITSWTSLAAARQVGEGYAIEISMPLKRFHKSINASGTLELTVIGKQPGERVAGSFDVTSDSMGTTIHLEGTFDFQVSDSAREDC